MVCNNIVLMYRDTQQLLIPLELRVCPEKDVGILYCCSSPSSAPTKVITRYKASGATIGTRSHMVAIKDYFERSCCDCDKATPILMFFGVDINICERCLSDLREICYSLASNSPYHVTLHDRPDGHVVMLAATGMVMRMLEGGQCQMVR